MLPSEPQLFQSPSSVDFGSCVPPKAQESRRLGVATIGQEAAEMACADVDSESYDMCVFDVIAMADLDAADIHGAF